MDRNLLVRIKTFGILSDIATLYAIIAIKKSYRNEKEADANY